MPRERRRLPEDGRTEAVRLLPDEAAEGFGGVDVTVNNAGYLAEQEFTEVNESEFRRGAAFLASDFASNVNGESFVLDGGSRGPPIPSP